MKSSKVQLVKSSCSLTFRPWDHFNQLSDYTIIDIIAIVLERQECGWLTPLLRLDDASPRGTKFYRYRKGWHTCSTRAASADWTHAPGTTGWCTREMRKCSTHTTRLVALSYPQIQWKRKFRILALLCAFHSCSRKSIQSREQLLWDQNGHQNQELRIERTKVRNFSMYSEDWENCHSLFSPIGKEMELVHISRSTEKDKDPQSGNGRGWVRCGDECRSVCKQAGEPSNLSSRRPRQSESGGPKGQRQSKINTFTRAENSCQNSIKNMFCYKKFPCELRIWMLGMRRTYSVTSI